eukprot:scaffold42993_cov56-Phaeocystis_antarctica.AAC.6
MAARPPLRPSAAPAWCRAQEGCARQPRREGAGRRWSLAPLPTAARPTPIAEASVGCLGLARVGELGLARRVLCQLLGSRRLGRPSGDPVIGARAAVAVAAGVGRVEHVRRQLLDGGEGGGGVVHGLRETEGHRPALRHADLTAGGGEDRRLRLEPLGLEQGLGGGRDGQHLDAVDVVGLHAEPRLLLRHAAPQHAHRRAGGEGRRVDVRALGGVPVGLRALELGGEQRQAQVAHVVAPHHLPQQRDGVPGVDGLARALLVAPEEVGLASGHGDARGPAVAHVPILVPVDGEEGVVLGGVGDVAHHDHDVLEVLRAPLRIEGREHRVGVDVVPVVEVVVVVPGVAKVHAHVAHRRAAVGRPAVGARRLALALAVVELAAARDDAAPARVEHERVAALVVEPHLDVLLELGQELGPLLAQAHGGGVGDERDVGHLREHLAAGLGIGLGLASSRASCR